MMSLDILSLSSPINVIIRLLLGRVFILKMSSLFCGLTLFVNSEWFYVLLADLTPANAPSCGLTQV